MASLLSRFCRKLAVPGSAHGARMVSTTTSCGSETVKSLNLYSAINQALHIALETDPRWDSLSLFLEVYDLVLESDFGNSFFFRWKVLCIWGRCWVWWSLPLHNRISWTVWQKPCLQHSSLWASMYVSMSWVLLFLFLMSHSHKLLFDSIQGIVGFGIGLAAMVSSFLSALCFSCELKFDIYVCLFDLCLTGESSSCRNSICRLYLSCFWSGKESVPPTFKYQESGFW